MFVVTVRKVKPSISTYNLNIPNDFEQDFDRLANYVDRKIELKVTAIIAGQPRDFRRDFTWKFGMSKSQVEMVKAWNNLETCMNQERHVKTKAQFNNGIKIAKIVSEISQREKNSCFLVDDKMCQTNYFAQLLGDKC